MYNSYFIVFKTEIWSCIQLRAMTEKLGYSDIICPYPLRASEFVAKLSRIFFLSTTYLHAK